MDTPDTTTTTRRPKTSAESMRERRAAIPKGLCIVCVKNKHRPKRRTCQDCNDAAARRVQRKRDAKKRAPAA